MGDNIKSRQFGERLGIVDEKTEDSVDESTKLPCSLVPTFLEACPRKRLLSASRHRHRLQHLIAVGSLFMSVEFASTKSAQKEYISVLKRGHLLTSGFRMIISTSKLAN